MNSLIIFICLFLMLIILRLIFISISIKIDCEKIGRNFTRSDRNIIVDKDGTKHYEVCMKI